MHVPGHNPYITESNPLSFQTEFLDFSLPGYQYQGMNPEIMSSLQNIFTPQTDLAMSMFPFLQSEGYGDEVFLGMPFNYDVTQFDILFGPESPEFTLSGTQPSGTWEGTIPIEEGMDISPMQFVDVFDPESLAATLSSMAGVDPSDDLAAIRPGEVRALTPEMIEKTESQYYSPYEESERADLVEQKVKSVGGASTGGFAGSAGRQSGLSGAERLYRGGYEDLIAQIETMKGESTDAVLDTIYGWQELMSEV